MSLRALVIGNGESRLQVDLNSFKKNYTLIGCNALYRDLEVSHLVCCDPRMLSELAINFINKQTKIYTRSQWINQLSNLNQLPNLPYHGSLREDEPKNWGSGVYAILLSCNLEFDEIFLLGFDLYSVNNKFNNVYKGTKNYKDINSDPINSNLWIYQISKIFECFPNKNFTIINKLDWMMPIQWQKENVQFMNIELFKVDSINSSVVQ